MEGRVVSHFRVLEKLGGGGMGVVYRAEDLRLGRAVALKFLPQHLTRDPMALERFRREARAASALDHPNICQVLDIGEDDSGPFIVLELLKGRTLMPRRLPLEGMLELAIQIAAALEAAHESGIVHRDLKPSNIFVTDRGQAKVLDFGLAKVAEGALGSPALSSGTEEVTSSWTSPGTVLGTVAYMSPEQARGEALDARTDLFSFGAVLFEMATGRPAFEGDTPASLFSAILNRKAAPPSGITPGVPAELDRIVLKALEKDREVRYQSARDLLADLKRLKRDTSSGTGEAAGSVEAPSRTPASSAKARRRLLAGGALAAALGLALLVLFRPQPPVPRVKDYVQITSDRVEKYGPWWEAGPLTDGSRVYFNDLGHAVGAYVAASGGEVVPFPAPFTQPWILVDVSRDGADLLVVVFDGIYFQPGELWVVPAVGGTPRRVADLRANYAAWSPDGKRMAVTKGNDLYFAAADGSDAQRVWTAPGFLHSPAWSPDGRRLRLSVKEASVIRRSALWEVDVAKREARPLLKHFDHPACCGRWTEDGRYFFFEAGDRRSDLWVLPERTGWLTRSPEPVRITDGVMQFFAPLPSRDGHKLFAVGWKPQGELVRYDPGARNWLPYLGGMSAQELDFSRDGQWVVFTTYPEGSVWRSHLDGRDRLQLTFPPVTAALPHFSPDGSQVLFTALGPEPRPQLRLVPAAGGSSRAALPADQNSTEATWSADGRKLAFSDGPVLQSGASLDRPMTIKLLELETSHVSTLPGSEGLNSPRWSPDGRFLAALSADASRLMLYEFTSGHWRVLLSSRPNELAWPTWSRDNRHLIVCVGAAIIRLGIADGAQDTVGSVAGFQEAQYYFGSWVGATPDGLPLALRNLSVNEIFALPWEMP